MMTIIKNRKRNLRNLKLLLILFISVTLVKCENRSVCEKPIECELVNTMLCLNNINDSDAQRPPVLYLDLILKNNTNYKYAFINKGSEYDQINSKLVLLDTVKNFICPLYSTNSILLSRGEAKIVCMVNLRKMQSYLDLDEKFFSKKDYIDDKPILTKKCLQMINNSVIVYLPDAAETDEMKIWDKEVIPILNAIQIKKEKKMTFISYL